MIFFVFLLVNATLFIRPTDMFPALENLPIYGVLITICCLGALRQMTAQVTWRSLIRQPTTLCVLGILIAGVLSHLTHVYGYGIRESGIPFFKTVLYYLALVGIVDTPRRLRLLLMTLAASASLMVSLCVVDYAEIVDFPFVTHHSDWEVAPTETIEGIRVLRMRGTGLFQDPNDVSVVIVMASALCAYFLTDRRMGTNRWLWLLPIAVMLAGLLFTRSRGGLLTAGAAGLAFVLYRYGRKPAIAVALLGVCAMSLVAGRQGKIELSQGTGQERIQLWSDGLNALKSADFLFGIGMGRYADVAGLVAHNSYLHAYVELGFFGGTLFFGCVFFCCLALHRMHLAFTTQVHPELVRLHPYLAAIVAGWGVGMFSLSRCYVVPTYLVFGMVTAYVNLVRTQLYPRRLLAAWDQQHVTHLVAGSGALLAGLFVFVRIFVRWS